MQRLTRQIRGRAIPVSFGQEYLLRGYRNANLGSAYNLTSAVRIASKLDVGAVEKSVKELIHRHEILRTHFDMVGDEFIQVIDEQPHLDFTFVDLSARPKAEHVADARRFVTDVGQKSFDIWTESLIRIGLCRLAPDDYFLIVVMHHLVSDAWSFQNLAREFDQLYSSFVRGLPSPLAPLPFQYADFAIWQRNRFQGSFLDDHIAYWTRHMEGAPLLELPTDKPRPSASSSVGAACSIILSRETSTAARELANKENVTLFTVLFATFAAVLSDRSGQKDVVIGTPIGARGQPGMEKLIGWLINVMPIRIDLSGKPCFRELLKQVRDVTFGALTYYELPLIKLESELHRNGKGRKSFPLFRVVFAMQNVPREPRSLGQLNAVPVEVGVNTARRDLSLFLYDWSDSIHCVMEYSTDIFEAATVGNLLTRFEQALKFATDKPDSLVTAVLPSDGGRLQTSDPMVD